MKRGKDEEKNMGPMFPRLHINDTEKGGPRAPPRNKMALYEQLSIPSQRFNPASMPINTNNNSNLTLPSSSQGSGHERGMFLPHQLPPSVHPADKPTRGTNLNPPLVHIEPKKRQDEEDFMVPIFVRSKNIENCNSMDKERNSLPGAAHSGRSVKFQKNYEKEPKHLSSSEHNLRREDSRPREDNSKEFVVSREKLNNSDSLSREKSESPSKQTNASSNAHGDHPPNYLQRLNNTNSCSHHVFRDDLQANETVQGDCLSIDQTRGMGYENSSILVEDIQQEVWRSPNNHTNYAESQEDTCRSLPTGGLDRGDDVSETSAVDSMSGTDLSPDDVVGIIGQKHFWKARRAIVNQQRVFAVQVFELHRLIKVQKLIAESPHILIEDNAFAGKPLKASSAKKLSLDYIVKATPKIVERKDASEKPDNRMESSAENAVEKTPISSLQNGSRPSNYGAFVGNPPQKVATSDPKIDSWGFNQPSGHQWLVPVMTPSEGLVYKPYPGPGFMGPVYGPPGSTPIMGNYLNYGPPVPHHPYQGLGPAFTPLAGPGYFPPFGMPVMAPSFSGSVEQTNHLNVQYQALCNMPSQKNGGASDAVKLNQSKDSEIQASMASSPSDKPQTTTGVGHTSEGRNALPLFPTSPAVQVSDVIPEEQPTRVIKVVPRNARSATESVARIFQSIQEERKQYE